MRVVAHRRIVIDADECDVAWDGNLQFPADVEHNGCDVVVHGEYSARLGEGFDPGLEADYEVVFVAEGPRVLKQVAFFSAR